MRSNVFPSQRGVAMIVVLWMIMVMMTLAASLIYATRTESSMVDYARRTATARAAADAAAHYAVMQLYMPNKDRDLQLGGKPLEWAYQGMKTEIRVVGENGLIDINNANRALLALIFKQVGVEGDTADQMLDNLEDFRDVDDLHRLHGAEDPQYEQAGLPFGAKDAPFERIEELQQVMGMTPQLYQALTRYLTVDSGSTGINPMLAPRQILLVLAEGDAAKVDHYLAEREEAIKDGRSVMPDFGQAFFDTSQQPLYRMQIRVFTDDSSPPYFEERAMRLQPGKMPPFVTYYKVLQEATQQFQ
jgi:general secretion pathway protein K